MISLYRQFRVLVGILFILVLLTAGSVYGATSGTIIYVNHDAVGNNDGSSWADAYTDLQDALGIAQAGDEIWVAQGVYYPAPDASDRTATFELQDGVGLYGGFAGIENQRHERDWAANVTVLSGDLDRNDITANAVVTDTQNITGDNAYNVVTAGGVTQAAIMDGFIVTAGSADGDWPHNHGGGLRNSSGTPTLTNLTFSGNRASNGGGGMYNNGMYSNSTLTNVTFSGNKAQSGGGLYTAGNSPRLTIVTFDANRADYGGGMYNREGSPTLSRVVFRGNRALVDGGGMESFGYGSPELTDVSFESNQALSGGGMYNVFETSPTLTNVTFSHNQADETGGGMCNAVDSSPELTNVSFTGNHAGKTGGAMHNQVGAHPTLTDVTFSENEAEHDGGGMYNTSESSSTLTDVSFESNRAGASGGGMSNDRGDQLTLTNVTFTNNEARSAGGGMHSTWTKVLTLTNVTFLNNEAGPYGGGMHNAWSSVTLSNGVFEGNRATVCGGGMHNHESGPALSKVNFSGNQSTAGDGGGMCNAYSSPTLTNVTFSGNEATHRGGGMYNVGMYTSPRLTNVTFSANKAIGGGAMYNALTSSPTLANCILWANSPNEVAKDEYSSVTITYSDVYLPSGVYTGTGNINQDPLFVAPLAASEVPTVAGNYRLRYDSPAIDSGNTLSVTATTDLDGNPRVVGENVDMGAYEYQAYTLTVQQNGEGDVTEIPGWPTYTHLDQIVLTATAHAGWVFAAWSGDVNSTANPLELTMEGDKTITATFEPREMKVYLPLVLANH